MIVGTLTSAVLANAGDLRAPENVLRHPRPIGEGAVRDHDHYELPNTSSAWG